MKTQEINKGVNKAIEMLKSKEKEMKQLGFLLMIELMKDPASWKFPIRNKIKRAVNYSYLRKIMRATNREFHNSNKNYPVWKYY